MRDLIPADYDGFRGEIAALLEGRRFGRGFGSRNVAQMRAFYLASPALPIVRRPSAQSLASQKVLATKYQMALPDEELRAEELDKMPRELDARRFGSAGNTAGAE